MKTSKRLVYNKVSKFLPYDTPLLLYFVSQKLSNFTKYEDVMNDIHEPSVVSVSDHEDVQPEPELLDSNEEEKIPLNSQGSILYYPDETSTVEGE